MLFNYHVKEMYFFFSTVCFFSSKTNQKKGGEGRGGRGEKAVGPQCEDNTALAQIGTETYCTTLKEWRPLGNGGRPPKKGAEKHAGLRFGINVKGLAIHSRTGKKNQAQETCPEKVRRIEKGTISCIFNKNFQSAGGRERAAGFFFFFF